MAIIILPGQEHAHESAEWWQFKGLVKIDAFAGSNNEPLIVMAESNAGERTQWVLKPLARLGEVGSIRELIGYRFALAMGIPVMESGIVEISERALNVSAELREALNGSVGPNFASRYVPGVVDLISASEVAREQRATATEIFAWDVLVDNADRRLQRSNLVVVDDRLIAIDHELTFSWFGAIGSPGPVWVPQILHRLAGDHFVSRHIARWAISLTEFRDRLQNLSATEISALTEGVPTRWLRAGGTSFLTEVRDYLANISSRAGEIINSIDSGRSG